MRARRHSLSFEWDAVGDRMVKLRGDELTERLSWFVQMRWIGTAVVVLLALVAAAEWLPANVDWRIPAVASVFLAASNVFYFLRARRLEGEAEMRDVAKATVIEQAVSDIIALGVVTYALGTLETPILVLYLPPIILVTLFFPRRQSLRIAIMGGVVSALPLALEHVGAIPTVSIFNGEFKQIAASSTSITLLYMAATLGACLVCWYMISTVSAGIRHREAVLEAEFDKQVQVDRLKSRATLHATHELKAPFAAIKSYVYTLRDGYCGELPPRALSVVGKIGARCDLLMSRLSGIIHLANLRTMAITSTPLVPTELTEILASEIALAAETGQPRGVKVVNRSDDLPPCTIRAAEPQLRTMLSNILRNAVTYSYENGVVEVETFADGSAVTVNVTDHGIGIAEEKLAKIFDEYFRCNDAVAHNPSGNGLGLPIVKEIARLHDAKLHVASEPERGTVFTVRFAQLG